MQMLKPQFHNSYFSPPFKKKDLCRNLFATKVLQFNLSRATVHRCYDGNQTSLDACYSLLNRKIILHIFFHVNSFLPFKTFDLSFFHVFKHIPAYITACLRIFCCIQCTVKLPDHSFYRLYHSAPFSVKSHTQSLPVSEHSDRFSAVFSIHCCKTKCCILFQCHLAVFIRFRRLSAALHRYEQSCFHGLP